MHSRLHVKKSMFIGAVLICIALALLFCWPRRPVIYYQPPSVGQLDLATIQRLVRARGERHFKWIVFSTVDSNEAQVAVSGGLFHPDRRGTYWLRRSDGDWRIYRVDDEDFPIKSM
jgi:hypothetical protein